MKSDEMARRQNSLPLYFKTVNLSAANFECTQSLPFYAESYLYKDDPKLKLQDNSSKLNRGGKIEDNYGSALEPPRAATLEHVLAKIIIQNAADTDGPPLNPSSPVMIREGPQELMFSWRKENTAREKNAKRVGPIARLFGKMKRRQPSSEDQLTLNECANTRDAYIDICDFAEGELEAEELRGVKIENTGVKKLFSKMLRLFRRGS